ncbi:MAG TPA: pilus assembly protein N-terminal domain-containing protein [Xanthobacteraceae bacterium]|nr:pilus assembly protein N-terminal domain-containing protein [Xanthobacteraceae bacterium]
MRAVHASRRRRPVQAILGIATLLVALAAARAHAADTITVALDQATISKLPERVATLVIGNPLIADVSVQAGGLLVVTGKGYGATNMIALDRGGAVLAERNIEVVGPRDKLVVVYRGINRETYSCMPTCEPRMTLGDGQDYFSQTGQQGQVRSSLAHDAATSAPAGVAPAQGGNNAR